MFRRVGRDRYLSDAELVRFSSGGREEANAITRCSSSSTRSAFDQPKRSQLHRRIFHGGWVRIYRLKKRKKVKVSDDVVVPARVMDVLSAYADTLASDPDVRLFPLSRRSLQIMFHSFV